MLAGTDFETHEWFPMLHGDGPAFRLNMKGRERDGIVPPEDRDRVLADIERVIAGVRTPDGAQTFASPWLPQQLYPGPRAHLLPDITVIPNPELRAPPPFLEVAGGVRLEQTHPPVRSGAHTAEGFLAHRGVNGRQPSRTAISTLDLAPSVTQILDVPISAHLQGESFVS